MNDENTDPNDPAADPVVETSRPAQKQLPLPGMAGIALYMLAISGVIAFGVVGHHIPPAFLVISLLTACGSFGLLRLLRWGWALSLAATFLLMIYQFYLLFRLHEVPRGILGAVNLVLFLYLVRPEVIERLK